MPVLADLQLVLPATEVDGLWHAITDVMEEPDATRLRSALPWRPSRHEPWLSGRTVASGIEGVETIEGLLPLTLRLPGDEILDGLPEELCGRDGPSRWVRGFLASVHADRAHALFVIAAQTKKLNAALLESRSMHATWAAIAERAGARLLFVTAEDALPPRSLWPTERVLSANVLFGPRDLDAHCEALIAACR